jgi:hypothetical protein
LGKGRSLTFSQTSSGIYDQLRDNYELLKEGRGAFVREAAMKATCMRKTQAKLEVLLDENLTMDHLGEILRVSEIERARHPMALETLIPKPRGRSTSTVWGDYLSAVRHFIHGTPMQRRLLIDTFSRIMKEDVLSWVTDFLKGADSTNRFFDNSAFCMKLLTGRAKEMNDLNQNEEYAYKIGRIAGKYIQFRRESGQAPRSSADILTYSKYDREKLRHVYSRVCNGVSLGTSASETLGKPEKDMTKFLEDNAPRTEIEDTDAFQDYSYFFYRGVFDSSKEGGGK